MEGLQGGVAVVGVGPGSGGSSLSTPTKARICGVGGGGGDDFLKRKRKRSAAGLDSSPGSLDEGGEDEGGDGQRRTPVVKRACNECRQQKLRCDVVQDPFNICGRCGRLGLDCKVESNFKRVGKRSKHAEMEREIIELRRQLASSHSLAGSTDQPSPEIFQNSQPHQSSMLASNEAVASLLDLKQGFDGSGKYLEPPHLPVWPTRTLGPIIISEERVLELFDHFFAFYHPFLPILEPSKPPEHYFKTSQLLFWTVLVIGARRSPSDPTLFLRLTPEISKLVWSTLADVPQNYHVVKALCLLCTWPLPISSTSTDATFMLSGVMTHVAMQVGLHRPSHAQDFTKFHVQLREEELKDRVKTWATCNIVAQSVATGYGQPPQTIYDWTLKSTGDKETSYQLPEDLETRLRIERFCDNVTRGLYSNENDPVGLTDDTQRRAISKVLKREFEELDTQLCSMASPIIRLHLRAAELHFRLSAFFDSSFAKDYQHDLLRLYWATTSFLRAALDLEPVNIYTPTEATAVGGMLSYASNYILQMMIAGGFTLLKLLNSFFASSIDLDEGKSLFHQTIWAIRKISIMTNDLPSRLAEVLAQLWRGGGEGAHVKGDEGETEIDSSLQLKVKCRMSMSLVYDSVWRWREEFQAQGRGNLDSAVRNPTNPDSKAESLSSHDGNEMIDQGLAPINGTSLFDNGLPTGGAVTPGPMNSYGESNYEVFDPLTWLLDGYVAWPYPLVGSGGQGGQGLEAGVAP